MFNIFYTNSAPSMKSLNYVSGSGVGALSRGTRAALKRRAIYGGATNGCCDKSVFNGYYWVIVQDGILNGAEVYVDSTFIGRTDKDGRIAIPANLSGIVHVKNGIDMSTALPNTLKMDLKLIKPFRNETFFINPVTSLINCIREKGLQMNKSIDGSKLMNLLDLSEIEISKITTSNPELNNKLQKSIVKIALFIKYIDKFSDNQTHVWDKIAQNVLEKKELFNKKSITRVVSEFCKDKCSDNIKDGIIMGVVRSIELIDNDSFDKLAINQAMIERDVIPIFEKSFKKNKLVNIPSLDELIHKKTSFILEEDSETTSDSFVEQAFIEPLNEVVIQPVEPKPEPVEPKPEPVEPKPEPVVPKPEPVEPEVVIQPVEPKPEKICLDRYTTLRVENGKFIFNGLSDYHTPYKLGLGLYLIKDVPAEHPIAIINDSSIGWTGNGNYHHQKAVVLPSGLKIVLDFYYGDVRLHVVREFNKASVYCLNHGFMGGENIFKYDSSCNINENEANSIEAPSVADPEYVALDDYIAIQYTNVDEIMQLRQTPYSIGFMADDESYTMIESVKSIFDGVRDVLENLLQFSHGHKYFGEDLVVRIRMEDLGNTPGGYPLAGAHIVNVAKSVIEGENNWPVECLVVINKHPEVWNELTTSKSFINGFQVPMLFNVMVHELMHSICMGWSVYESLKVGWHDAGLMEQNSDGWWYVGKENSLAIKTYRELTGNSNIDRIPIESDGHQGSIGHHFEEGFDDSGNRQIRKYIKDGQEIIAPSLPYELMSTFSTEYEILSMLTVGVLKDYGYRVNLESPYIGEYPGQTLLLS